MTLELFVLLMIFAHYVGDYVLQSRFLAETKGKEWYNMMVHCILYTGSVGWVLGYWINAIPYFGLIILFVSHWIIDKWKCCLNSVAVDEQGKRANLYMDQICHFMILVGLIIWYK